MKFNIKISCTKNKSPQIRLRTVVRLTGLEPATFRFVAECSIQLSYSHIYENIFKGNFGKNQKSLTRNPIISIVMNKYAFVL